jgi:hypothetical protein
MDTIKFVIEDYIEEEFGYRFPVINIFINGNNLIHLAEAVESKLPVGEIADDPWKYIGFVLKRFERFRSEMLGKKTYPFSILLTCTFAECNCLSATITFGEKTVTWSNIESPWFSEAEAEEIGWAPLNYIGLGPFTFDREQYLATLEDVTREGNQRKKVNTFQNKTGSKFLMACSLFMIFTCPILPPPFPTQSPDPRSASPGA